MFEKIYRAIQKFFLQKQFVFRFDYYDGTEKALEVYETNVAQYEFINQGTTVCVINGMELQPAQPFTPGITQLQPQRIIMDVNYNEKDVTVYKYRFNEPFIDKLCDAQPANFGLFPCDETTCNYHLNITIDGIPLLEPDFAVINCTMDAFTMEFVIGASVNFGVFGSPLFAVTFDGGGFTLTVTNLTLPPDAPGNIVFTLTPIGGGLCLVFEPIEQTLTCVFSGTFTNKLLVISKEFATVRKTNP